MDTNSKGKVLISGASTGIGATCADRLAKRGHDLFRVAHNRERLDLFRTYPAVFRRPGGGPLFGEAIAIALSAHIAQRYSTL